MKQIVQNISSGSTQVVDVPVPHAKSGHLVIKTEVSLISAGTERMLVEFGRASFINKARSQPEKVRQVLNKIKTDGLWSTIQAVKHQLDQPLPLGYCNVGTVLSVGHGVTDIQVGQRVLSNGPHAEYVVVPQNLCVPVPDEVNNTDAVFGVLGAIALQGIRLANIELGESIAVFGVGLVGLLTVQILKAMGCRVFALDFNSERLSLAEKLGAQVLNLSDNNDPAISAMAFSRGRGIDAALITATTKSSDPVRQAANLCRKRGRIVLVGVAGLELSRDDFYKKELSFQVSCSYGPGRYDPQYEEQGHDYPIAYVRWTEQRNFEAVLDLMAAKKLDLPLLISHQFDLEESVSAYELLTEDNTVLGIVLNYKKIPKNIETTVELFPQPLALDTGVSVGFIGAGNYASAHLIPAFKLAKAELKTLVARSGTRATHLAKKFRFQSVSSQVDEVMRDTRIKAVVIATRHDSHASLLCQALHEGKHVFVEKPLAINENELHDIVTTYEKLSVKPMIMVGFNRRFSPHSVKIKSLLASHANVPKAITMTVNAGFILGEHWVHDKAVGGGRIIGEVCHFVDLMRFLIGSSIKAVSVNNVHGCDDILSISLTFSEGSIATIHYFSNGHKSLSKERLEVFCGGSVLQLDNFRVLRGIAFPGFRKMSLMKQDKGQKACAQAFVDAMRRGGASPIPFSELLEVARITFEIANACQG